MSDLSPSPHLDPEAEERDDAIIGSALRWSLLVIALLLVAAAGIGYGLSRPAGRTRVIGMESLPLHTSATLFFPRSGNSCQQLQRVPTGSRKKCLFSGWKPQIMREVR